LNQSLRVSNTENLPDLSVPQRLNTAINAIARLIRQQVVCRICAM
jgi:hypothetical protein